MKYIEINLLCFFRFTGFVCLFLLVDHALLNQCTQGLRSNLTAVRPDSCI